MKPSIQQRKTDNIDIESTEHQDEPFFWRLLDLILKVPQSIDYVMRPNLRSILDGLESPTGYMFSSRQGIQVRE
jgi:hypothetical protein